jgi:hypothetical protein
VPSAHRRIGASSAWFCLAGTIAILVGSVPDSAEVRAIGGR